LHLPDPVFDTSVTATKTAAVNTAAKSLTQNFGVVPCCQQSHKHGVDVTVEVEVVGLGLRLIAQRLGQQCYTLLVHDSLRGLEAGTVNRKVSQGHC